MATGEDVAYLRPGQEPAPPTESRAAEGGRRGEDYRRYPLGRRILSYIGSAGMITGRAGDTLPPDEQSKEERAARIKKGKIGLLLFCVICVIASVIAHSMSRRYLLASAVVGVIMSVSYMVLILAEHGGEDPVFLLVLDITRGLLAFVIALLVGLPFLLGRNRAHREAQEELVRKMGGEEGASPPSK